MPIQFRCHHCRQVLSITSKKAGMLVDCTNCREATRVPTLADVQAALESKPPAPRPAAAPAPVLQPQSVAATGPEHEPGHEIWEEESIVRDPWTDEEADEEVTPRIRRPRFDEGGLDMTPMVDVTFLLLIFFMITASFNIQKSMPAEPPEPEDEGAARTEAVEEQISNDLVVGITANDELTLDDEPISGLGALGDALRAKAAGKTDLSMTVEFDPRCSFGIMVGVIDVGITTGMQRIKRVALQTEN
jgi:biopolymer transport protein ExbD